MSPTIVLDDGGSPVAAFGSPGGSTIITTVLQVAVNHLDLGMSLPEAIAAPRLSNRNTPTTQAEAGIRDTALGAALLARGHQLDPVDYLGNVTGVAFLPDGRLQAAAEPERARGGSAMVVRPDDPPAETRYGFFLTNGWRGGGADLAFMYGRHTDEVLIGDWDGNGTDTITVRRGATFFVNDRLRPGPATSEFVYGRPGDVVLVGDWDGDGTDTFAVRRGASFHVRNSLGGGPADSVVRYGRDGDVVLVGDWDGDGRDTLAVRRGAQFHVRNTLTSGQADLVFRYGRDGDVVLTGDWDGDGRDTLAVRRGAAYHVRNSLAGGPADLVVVYGRPTDAVLVGDWDGDGKDTLGVRRTP